MTASAFWLSVPPSPDTSEIGEGERVRCTAACMAPGRGAFAVRGLRRFLPGRGGLANSQCYERRREKLRGGAVCCSQHAFPTLVCVAGPRPATGRGGLSGPLQAWSFWSRPRVQQRCLHAWLVSSYEIIVGLWFLGAAFFIFLGGVGRCLHTTRRSHATPPRRHLGWAPLEGPGRSYPEKRRCSAVLSAMPRRHFRLETVVFRRGGTDVPRANQRGRAALGRTQGPKPPTILAMGLLRPLQAPTAGADTAACPVWAVSGRHFRQNGREMEPILSAVWA